MSQVLDRVRKLLALAASGNANEARNAAHLAARLIRDHGLELVEPASAPRRVSPAPRRTPRQGSSPRRGVRAVKQPPARIESPLGGDCIVCGKRYRAGSDIFWLDSDGGFHPDCFDAWARRYARRN